MTPKIVCATHKLTGGLMAKCVRVVEVKDDLYICFAKINVTNLQIFSVMISICQFYAT